MVDSIVFDLDKTLIYTSTTSVGELYRSGILEDPRFFEAAGRIYYFDLPENPNLTESDRPEGVSGMWGSMRPSARKFLRFCFKRFKRVIVFTAGTAEYAVAICKVLFQGIHKPYLIWSRGHCIQIGERAVDVDRRLVDLRYYDERSVPDDSDDMEYMNAKCLTKLAAAVARMENDDSVTRDRFMLVEDNYHSFITRDPLNAFFLAPYQSSNKAEISNIPGTPGYSPRLMQSFPTAQDPEEEEDNEDVEGRRRAEFPIITTNFPERKRKNLSMHNWLLYDDHTLDRLQKFIEENPNFTAEEYTRGWNAIYSAIV
jgi:hypothetical protein